MESSVLSAMDQQVMVSTFLEIAVGQTANTARQFLQATNWKLEEAIQLFYVVNESGGVSPSSHFPPVKNKRPQVDQSFSESEKDLGNEHSWLYDDNDVRAPLAVKREVLCDDAMLYGAPRMGNPSQEAHSVVPFCNFDKELKCPGIWESDQAAAASRKDNSQDNLASLYRPPFSLMLHGPFEKAKDAAKAQDKWLLVNLQSTREFSSHMVCDDTEEGSKVCTYYKLDSIPVVLVIDPVTGQKMRSWPGMVQPETLLEDLLPFMDGSPKDHHASLSHKRTREPSQATTQKVQVAADESNEEMQVVMSSMEGMKDISGIALKDVDETIAEGEQCKTKKPLYPPLPEEPKGDRNLLCRVGVRLPDERRLQRNFLRTDPVQLLWSFCQSQLEQADARLFHLNQAIPGASKFLEYESNLTVEQSGLSNSMISVT